MKKFWIITLSIFLSIVLIITCTFAYHRWRYIKEMDYCTFDMDGEHKTFFYLEDGRCYKSIPFPEGMKYMDAVDVVLSAKSEKIVNQNGGQNVLYYDPFGEGSEYAVIAPLPKFPPIIPVSSIALPFAYYVVEVDLS